MDEESIIGEKHVRFSREIQTFLASLNLLGSKSSK